MNKYELTELVETLRADADDAAGCEHEYEHLDRAADALEALFAENERLEERAEYWKQRAKSAEGHLYASDFEAAMKALHKRTLLAATEWDQLDAVQRAKLEAAVSVVLGAVNEQRASRKPKDDGHE